MTTFTHEDARLGHCEHWQIGTERCTITTEKVSPKDLVDNYMDVFYKMGGVEALSEFAKRSPGKFYDQLLRLLISMEAPKQSMQVNVNLNTMSSTEMESLPTNELKLRLLQSKS